VSAPDVQRGDPLVTEPANPNPPVATIKDRCRSCYTCVRECPVKAIRVSDGQAEVMFWRCIGCGNCVRVCSQKAKQVASSIETVGQLLSSHNTVAACLAPSYPAEFPEMDHRRLVGILRAMGFTYVHEVAFGADLVAAEYQRLLAHDPHKRFITSTCPAIVGFVQKYHPGLVASLAPICSPMVATARVLRLLHGLETKIVFIGPCIAKKLEASAPELSGEVSAVLTFAELQKMISTAGITPDSVAPVEFDPPRAGQGALFPLAKGMLQTAGIPEDLLRGNVVTADGCSSFMEAIKEFETGDLDAQLIELLCCNGCIMGPGMTSRASLFRRRSIVSQHVRNRLSQEPPTGQTSPRIDPADLDLSRYFLSYKTAEVELREADLEEVMACMGRHSFSPADLQVVGPSDEEIRRVLERIGKRGLEDELSRSGRERDVLALHHRAASPHLARPGNLARSAPLGPGSADAVGEAGKHGAAGFRHRPRGE
jgi:two-component system NtrC family sensor kinase